MSKQDCEQLTLFQGDFPANRTASQESAGVDGRIKHVAQMTALGNAVVPQQFYPIFRAIAEVEEMYG